MATFVKGDAVLNASSYELLENVDGTYNSLATADDINFEVSALGLAAGDHVLVVQAKGDGTTYSDSDYSNEVTYTVEEENLDPDGDGYYDNGMAVSYPIGINSSQLKQGTLSSSAIYDNDSKRIRTDYAAFLPGMTITLNLNGGWYGYVAYRTSADGGGNSLLGTGEWTQNEVFTFGGDKKGVYQYAIVLKNDTYGTITPDMFTAEDGGTITVDFASSDLTLTSEDLVVGGLSTSSFAVNTSETDRMRTGWLGARKGTTVTVNLPDGFSAYLAWCTFGSSAMEYTTWTTGTLTKTFDGDYGFVVVLKQGSTVFTDTSAFTKDISVVHAG